MELFDVLELIKKIDICKYMCLDVWFDCFINYVKIFVYVNFYLLMIMVSVSCDIKKWCWKEMII